MRRREKKKRARISRNRTRAQEEEEDEKPDRLSDLPDPIIHQILAFLDIKYAIQSCVLSKRWKHLWVSLPDLKFNGRCFTRSKFTKFVRNVLSTRSADCNICKFELYCCPNPHHSLPKRVLNYVVSHNVQHLYIHLDDDEYDAPLYSCISLGRFLTCNMLKTLKLNNIGFKALSESFSFGFTMLTSMNLSNCDFYYESESGFTDLFASCPNLKNLCLEGCYFRGLKVLKISGLQLLNLKIDGGYMNDSKIQIFAPKLTSFYFEVSQFINFSSVHIPSLCYADIRLTQNPVWVLGTLVQKEKYCLGIINLFRGLHNAEFVSLSSDTINELLKCFPSLEEQQPVPFIRLKSLKVKCYGNSVTIPDHVKKYLLGDHLYEETMYTEVTSYLRTSYAEFRKVQA